MRVSFPSRSRGELLDELAQGLARLRDGLPVERAVLFGSRATGRHTAASDIDLLVIYSDPHREDAFALVRKTLKLRGLQPHLYTRAEAERLGPMLERMTRGGVELPC